MSSMVSMILNKNWTMAVAPGRVVRFGEESDRELTEGPVRKRILRCLETRKIPMDVQHIADMVIDKPFRVGKMIRQLMADGLVEEVSSGSQQRYQIASMRWVD